VAQQFAPGESTRQMTFLIPLVVFGVLAALLAVGLSLNPREIPSALIGRVVPEFNLPPVKERPLALAGRDLKGEVSLVNVFASWCVACQAEHPILERIWTGA
jgi:cytochrome c biogenesis protein CcmG/thiol:disulfide interchange protein DsbE